MHVRAILLDYGGTLDGCANHWLDRFLCCYRAAGLDLPFQDFRPAFDHATQCAYADGAVPQLGLQALVEFHVARQLEHMHLSAPAIAQRVTEAFVQASLTALEASRLVLQRLHRRVALGVISNFYGNLAVVLSEAGLAPVLDTIVDSSRVGLRKPDAEIFALALRQLSCCSADALHVGDSFEKDIVGAHQAGLRTAWLIGAADPACRSPECVDFRIRRLADLEALIA
jgi:putative hydrolase of the HAD superfamily